MKNLLFLFMLTSAASVAQVKLPANEAGQVQYQEIVRIGDGKSSARQLMTQVRSWARQHYPAANEAEQQLDSAHNVLFVRTFYPIGRQSVRYTLTIETKFGRYRATITDLVAETPELTLPVQPASSTVDDLKRAAGNETKNEQVIEKIAEEQAELYRQIDKSCRATLASLKESLTASAAQTSK